MASTPLSWVTPAGDLGTYSSGQTVSYQLVAIPEDPSSMIRYELLSGELPAGISTFPITISSDGLLSGVLDVVDIRSSSSFTVRAFDQFANVRDRTFNINVVNKDVPMFSTPTGSLFTTVDSTYVSYNIDYVNPTDTNIVNIRVSSGTLPPGLRIASNGLISGYAEPPILYDKSPTTKTYTFSLQLTSALGNDSNSYSITVSNFQINHPSNTRAPAVTNNRPTAYPISTTDVYYDYYLGSDGVIGTINANEYFSFKVIGYDFDGSPLSYSFTDLPAGLIGDTTTGWITGSIAMDSIGVNKYEFSAQAYKTSFTSIRSDKITFTLLVSNEVQNDIVWNSDSNLGTIANGEISELFVSASSSRRLVYTLTAGVMPPNLVLAETGELSGRIAFQPTGQLLSAGAKSVFNFTIVAYADDYPLLKSAKEFTITVNQQYKDPLETVYIKASPSIANREILKTLLSDTNLIPTNWLYRPNDPYFGKAKDIRFAHAYGVKPTSVADYIAAIQNNHYTRRVFLGNLKTAVARDINSNIVYEVVYSEILDDLDNPSGKSVSSTVQWPTPIKLYNNTTIISVNTASLTNMRHELLTNIQHNPDIALLPKWMNTQQLTGNTTGYVQGWVICYTIPTKAETVKSLIENNWTHSVRDIEFIIDRYIVDKSATYNWNLNLQIPAWSELPSATPAPSSIEDNNYTILFPKKSIIPTSSQ